MVKPITNPTTGTTTIELSEADKKILAKSRDIWLQIQHYETNKDFQYDAGEIAHAAKILLSEHATATDPEQPSDGNADDAAAE